MICECSDSGCKQHEGVAECKQFADVELFRVDYELFDRTTGIPFCEGCAEDALESGVFTTRD